MWKLLKPREIRESPFSERDQDQRAAALGPAGARRAGALHRVDRRRQAASPVYLGLRDDKTPAEVTREASVATGVARRAAVRQGSRSLREARTSREHRQQHAMPRGLEHGRRPTARARGRAASDGAIELPDGATARRHQPGEGVLAGAEADEGRSAALLRAGLAADPAGGRRSAAGDEALPERHRQAGVLPAAIAHRAAAGGRAHRDARRRPRSDLRARRAPLRRRHR